MTTASSPKRRWYSAVARALPAPRPTSVSTPVEGFRPRASAPPPAERATRTASTIHGRDAARRARRASGCILPMVALPRRRGLRRHVRVVAVPGLGGRADGRLQVARRCLHAGAHAVEQVPDPADDRVRRVRGPLRRAPLAG